MATPHSGCANDLRLALKVMAQILAHSRTGKGHLSLG
ncbi:rCG59256 [Rattus norvegicus]|uniref:RCG59256 n=1 Tax=Rattus norvegicus TaxID=10116 RepID=A6K7V5_RAT|nr:rCG59256 [Rattus norvegicus]